MASENLLVQCTCPDESTSVRIAEALVSAGLAACVNICPNIRSIYRWQGEIQQDQEHLLLIKTTQKCYSRLEKSLQELHPYELPEIIAVSIEYGLPGYLNWIDESCERKTD